MRTRFTPKELRRAQELYKSYLSFLERDYDEEGALIKAAKSLKLGGTFVSGAYRHALVTPKLVFKVIYTDGGGTQMRREYEFIQKMKNSEFARHFPLTTLVGPKMIMQETIRRVGDEDLYDKYESHMMLLAKQLRIDDAHEENVGWCGAAGREWPVFIDVEFRVRGRPARIPSWVRRAA